jgi:hypothetical protein
MTNQKFEGWYTDSCGRHDARWMSTGQPTRPVRDGGVGRKDDPPNEERSVDIEKIVPDPPAGSDQPRVDDLEDEVTTKQIYAAVFASLTGWEGPRKNRR